MKRNLFIISLFIASTLLGATTEEKTYKGPLYPRPTTDPMHVSIVIEPHNIDGMPHYRSVVSCSLFTANSFAPIKWTPTQIPGTSFAYRGKFFPNVQWSMSLWQPESFLPNLSDGTMLGYAEALKKTYGKDITILNDESYRIGPIRVVFNRETRTLEYDLFDPSTNTTSRHYDTFVMFKDHLIEFSLWGPVDEVEGQHNWYSIVPRNLSLDTEDKDYEDEITRAYKDPEPEPEEKTAS